MATSDMSVDGTQQLLKWILGQPTNQFTAPLHARFLSAYDATTLTPGTEVPSGAATRVPLNLTTVQNTSFDERTSASSRDASTGAMVWPGPSTTVRGYEIWDASTPPRRLAYDLGNTGFNLNENDLLEWQPNHTAFTIVAFGMDQTVLVQAVNWLLGRPTGWIKPVPPFKMKLIQKTDFNDMPKSTLENTPMQTITFSPVGLDADNRATTTNNISVVFPTISETHDVLVEAYEIWDSSPTPRRIIRREAGQDFAREGYSTSFIYVPPGNSLTIPVGSLRITMGSGD